MNEPPQLWSFQWKRYGKTLYSIYCNITTIFCDKANFIRLCHRIWLFLLYWMYGLSIDFPADGPHDWGIVSVISLEFQGIKHQPFPMAQPFIKGSVIAYGCFISTVRWKYSLFLRFSPWLEPPIRHFSGYPFGASRKKASTIFYNTAFIKGTGAISARPPLQKF